MWETVLVYLFDLMGGTSSIQPYAAVLVEISFAVSILAIVLCVHMYVRNWAEDGSIDEKLRIDAAVRDAGAATAERASR